MEGVSQNRNDGCCQSSQLCIFTSVSCVCFLNSSENVFPSALRKQNFRNPKYFQSLVNISPQMLRFGSIFQLEARIRPKVYVEMGRRVPTTETHPIHYALSISLLAVWIAVTIAIVAALCGTKNREKPSPPPSESSSVNQTAEKSVAASKSLTVDAPGSGTGMEGEGGSLPEKTQSTETLPLPPMLRKNEIGPARILRSASVSHSRGGEFMASINFRRSLSVARHPKEGRKRGRRDKANQSDSIWMKTIILGEKCRVPHHDEQVYENKGQKIEAYRRIGSRSLPVSRSNSFVDLDAVAEADAAPQQMGKGEGT